MPKDWATLGVQHRTSYEEAKPSMISYFCLVITALEHKSLPLHLAKKEKKKRILLYPEVITEFPRHQGRVGKQRDGTLFVALMTARDQVTWLCLPSSDKKFLEIQEIPFKHEEKSDCEGD